ncbi:ribose-phosphate pyrophosphokinase 1 [Aspergillus heteromorphus CBS 117.55]|uniref:Ribose-phosphate pyrophosphokinase 1 n=1 Tax=Aspergillus heteromorphus CBS 117.55 TaxID=1448321 RepID=A0A317WXA6_9EURO|nr:ribose-phosphate pyrophosphokinase 1 [Aspergillus heteromorphus CBS 117.55]PWY90655.1 ribose-phosphate pyrophosphokinase 1 [Aspergillus heteromorphus CBS 117.55]
MRGVQIFSGTSHPLLAETICERLGTQLARADLGKFSNGETSVNIGCSVRNQDIYIVQSGSGKINDSVMELLIMISACKGGSAKSITAVMPYFPYSRQSKKKSHRGAITARMLANLLSIAGVDHVITLDLHASQMQGFFGKPVDNLFAEPFIARWIRMNVPGWREAVVVSKNAGGTKRVTSLADTLKLNFGIVTTDRRRPKMPMAMSDSTVFFDSIEEEPTPSANDNDQDPFVLHCQSGSSDDAPSEDRGESNANMESLTAANYLRPETPSGARRPSELEAAHEYTDVRVREVITGRLVQGHLVDDDYPSTGPTSHPASGETTPGQTVSRDESEPVPDAMVNSMMSTTSSIPADHALGGSFDAAESSDDEEGSVGNYLETEKTITLVGDVRGRTVFIMDDMIDKSKSWIAAAETVVKKGGAKKVYCIATHGLFTDESLEQMEECESIDHIVVTNSFPVPPQLVKRSKKLIVIDVSSLIAESIRRHHYGESVSALFHLND